MFGGAAVLPGVAVSFTSLLLPGVYRLVNYRDLIEGGVPQAAARARTLTIGRDWSSAAPPRAAATCLMTLAGAQARFWLPPTLDSNAPLRITNAMPQLGGHCGPGLPWPGDPRRDHRALRWTGPDGRCSG